MLHREYFPFMPAAESAPRGPIDHPMLQAEAPEGWWDASALEMFDAAEHIARILSEASECGAELLTPFVGFCVFSAAYMNLYVFRFPDELRAELARRREFESLSDIPGSLSTGVEAWRELGKCGLGNRDFSSFLLRYHH